MNFGIREERVTSYQTLILLVILPCIARSWMFSTSHQYFHRHASATHTTKLYHSGPFFEDEFEFECPEEQEKECEIDWNMMPAMSQMNTGEEDECDDEDGCEIDWEAMPDADDYSDDEKQSVEMFGYQVRDAFDSKPKGVEKSRVHLEMNWQIEECRDTGDSCEDFCPECAGSGEMTCQFCRGTKLVAFGNEFRPCIICSTGKVDCASCRGTGMVAPWATTMDKYLAGNSTATQNQDIQDLNDSYYEFKGL